MSGRKKIWYNYWHKEFISDEPAFYDVNQFLWAKKIEKSWPEIEREITNLIKIKNHQFKSYFSSEKLAASPGWKTISLKTWGNDVKENLNYCPCLKNLIDETPGWVSAAISLLEPQTSIKKHQGDTNAIYRSHLGFKIPGQLPECGIKVNNFEKKWETGKLVVFLDAHWHEAWNNTHENRVVLIFDVVKDEFLNQKQDICINVRSFLIFQYLENKAQVISKLPVFVRHFIFLGIYFLLKLLYPYQKKKGVILKHH